MDHKQAVVLYNKIRFISAADLEEADHAYDIICGLEDEPTQEHRRRFELVLERLNISWDQYEAHCHLEAAKVS